MYSFELSVKIPSHFCYVRSGCVQHSLQWGNYVLTLSFLVRQCRVYRSFNVDSDHFPVLATLKLKLKRSTQPQTKHFIPNLSSLSNIDVSQEYVANVSSKLRATSLEDQTLEAMWGHYKNALNFAARQVLGKRLCAKKPRISQATLTNIDQRRQAI